MCPYRCPSGATIHLYNCVAMVVEYCTQALKQAVSLEAHLMTFQTETVCTYDICVSRAQVLQVLQVLQV